MNYKILLLEDDRLYNETLKEFLEDEGFIVDSVLDPYSAYDLTYKNNYDLYIFDINLPFEDGITTLKSLRNANDITPTIFITSRDDKESLLEGFSAGASDYIKKPIDLDELLARVNVAMSKINCFDKVDIGRYSLDRDKRVLKVDGKSLHISNKEFLFVELLFDNLDRVVSYDEIYSKLWRYEEPSNSSLRVYASSLKKIFGTAIESIRGFGYMLHKDRF